MAIHASRNTLTGLTFEQKAALDRKDGVNISKKKFCSFFKTTFNIDPLDYLAWKFEPDEAYYFPERKELIIYEKKTQHCSGSADMKLPACGWWYQEYQKLCNAVGIFHLSYIFILDEWFKNTRYKSILEFIKATPGCDYFFWGDETIAN